MTDIVRGEVVATYPELTYGSDELWITALADANRISVCGETATTLRSMKIALAAHTVALSRSSSSGAVKREKVGTIEREYFGGSADDSLESTRYGRIYRALLDSSLAAGPHLA